MTREHKLALVVGFGLVLFVGILIADHMAAEVRTSSPQWRAAMIQQSSSSMPDGLLQGVPLLGSEKDTSNQDRGNQDLAYEGPNVEFAPREPRDHVGRPPNTPPNRGFIPSSPGATYYTVLRGDSLTRIAQKELGNQNRWREIKRLNGLPNQNITEGQKLRMPDDGSSRPATQTRYQEVEMKPQEYTVLRGDSLTRIAKKRLGNQNRWREIQRLNKLPDQDITVGQQLLLPTR